MSKLVCITCFFVYASMGRRKRLCITSTEIPERQLVETHETTETQGDQSSSQGHHPIETEGDQSSEYEISSNEQGMFHFVAT